MVGYWLMVQIKVLKFTKVERNARVHAELLALVSEPILMFPLKYIDFTPDLAVLNASVTWPSQYVYFVLHINTSCE